MEFEKRLIMLTIAEINQQIASLGAKYSIIIRIGIAVVILALQVVIIKVIFALLKVARKKIDAFVVEKIKPIKTKNQQITIFNKRHIQVFFDYLIKAVKFLVIASFLLFTIPLLLSLFEPTRNIASTLFGYIMAPLKSFALAILKYIPNAIYIAVIIFIARYILRILKFFSKQITAEKIKIQGFYSDWADTTFNILRILIYAFTVAMIFPLLPGSDSQIFQGVSILVGVLFSLGSSSFVGNFVAGIVLTYMRPFKIGDRIKINDVTGFVVEKNHITTRIRTHKNEFVSFPNQMVLNASITNFNSSTGDGAPGLILHTEVTFGYDTPFELIESLLIKSADITAGLEKTPPPFVLQKKLSDFYCVYELNVYTKDVSKMIAIYSELHRNIQAQFTAAGLDLTAHYFYNGASTQAEITPPDNTAQKQK